jgi:hypothetical protein
MSTSLLLLHDLSYLSTEIIANKNPSHTQTDLDWCGVQGSEINYAVLTKISTMVKSSALILVFEA